MNSIEDEENQPIEIEENIIDIENLNEDSNNKNEQNDKLDNSNDKNENIKNEEEGENKQNEKFEDYEVGEEEIIEQQNEEINNLTSQEKDYHEKENEKKEENNNNENINNIKNDIIKEKNESEIKELNKIDVNTNNEKKNEKNNSNNYYSYKPSEYKSILLNTDLTETDKLLLEKYNNNYNIGDNNINYNYDFNKYNYHTIDEPKSSYFSPYNKCNYYGKYQQIYSNNIYKNDLNYLIKNEKKDYNSFLEKNYLKDNDKDKNSYLSNNQIKDDKIDENENLSSINLSPKLNLTYSILYSKIDDNRNNFKMKDYDVEKEYSNNNFLEKNNVDLNNKYSYNIPKNYSPRTKNLLKNTSLENYHIPHTQYSYKKKPLSKYSPFDFDRLKITTNYTNNSSNLNNNNNRLDKNFNQSKELNISKDNSYNNILSSFDDKNKSKSIIKENNLENSLNHKNNLNDNAKIKINQNNEDDNYYKKTIDLLKPYQYNPYKSLLQDNLNLNEDLIIKQKRRGAFRDENNEIMINTSPTDIYYNTLHSNYIPKTDNKPIKNISYYKKTYQIDSNQDFVNKKNNLLGYSTILTDLMNKNKKYNFSKY